MFKIEKNIEMPMGKHRGKKPIWLTLIMQMEVGDSVLVTSNQATALKNAAKKMNRETKQSIHNCEDGFVRVWRKS